MYSNHWLDRALTIVENEVILVSPSSSNQSWFNKMPSTLPACHPDKKVITCTADYGFKVGHAHHLRLSKYGIEGVLKAPRKFHRFRFYVYYSPLYQPSDPFWIVFHKD